jgi:thiamine biosynthesis lipoprotein
MPESRLDPDNRDTRQGGPARTPFARTLFLSIAAMVVGYYCATYFHGLWGGASSVVREFEVMRTYARITIPEDSGAGRTPASLADRAEKAIREVNDLMGPFGEHSDVRRLNEAPAGVWVEVSPSTWKVVMEALRWHRLSGGAFDPTVGPIKRLFTFDRSKDAPWPDADALAEAQSRVGADKLLFDREGMRLSWARDGMYLDLGAIAKGFAVDQAYEALAARGVRNALVDVGGELRVMGERPGNPPRPWRAGVRHPRDDDRIIRELPLDNAAVATSGDYEAYFIHDGVRHEHIIDPRKGLPLTESVASVTVIHPDSCLAADALATTLCVLGSEDGRKFIEGQALGLFAKGVRVIMVSVGEGGRLDKLEITVEPGGAVRVEEDAVE